MKKLWIIFALFLVSACASPASDAAPTIETAFKVEDTPAQPVEAVEEIPTLTLAQPDSAPEVAPTATPTEKPGATTAAVKTELAATDPSSFQLASSEVQLVEFFAFW